MKTQQPSEDRVCPKVIAKRYGVSVRTVERHAKSGKIPSFKFGDSYRFDLAAVIEAVEGKKP